MNDHAMNSRPFNTEKISQAQVKWLSSLQHKKYRQKYDKFIVEGEKIVQELIDHHRNSCEYIVIEDSKLEKIHSRLGQTDIKIYSCDPGQYKKMSSLSSHPGILAVAKVPEYADSASINGPILYLDGIRDPGNLGTILRLADWYGLIPIIASKDTVDYLNAKVVQSSMGSLFRVPLVYIPLEDLVLRHPDHEVFVMDLEGDSLGQSILSPKGIYVIGSESHGPIETTKRVANRFLSIRRHNPSGLPESLNAATAAAILCAEIRRQFPVDF